MVERGVVSGTCVNVGCIPSKVLLVASEPRHTAATAGRFPGLAAASMPVDFAGLIAGKDTPVGRLRTDRYLDLPPATVGKSFPARQFSAVTRTTRWSRWRWATVAAGHYLIAAGAAPWVPPVDGLEIVRYLTSATAMELHRARASLLAVGGNAVGLEPAELFRLGTRVSVIEALRRLAPCEDPKVSAAVASGDLHRPGHRRGRHDRGPGDRNRAEPRLPDPLDGARGANACRPQHPETVGSACSSWRGRELITAASYAISAGFTVDQLAGSWAPYLTAAEALRLAARAYTRDVAELSCCAS